MARRAGSHDRVALVIRRVLTLVLVVLVVVNALLLGVVLGTWWVNHGG
jgi:hypothetical protein